MSNKETLKSFGKDKPTLTHEEAVKNGKKGVAPSLETRRRNKTFKEAIEKALSLNASKDMVEHIKKAFNILDGDITNKDAMIYAQLLKAIKKEDTAAFSAIIDRVEGKPTQSIDATVDHNIPEKVTIEFVTPENKKDKK